MHLDRVALCFEGLCQMYSGADKSLARPGRKQTNVCQNGVNFLRLFALEGGVGNLMTARVSILLKSRAFP